MTTSTTNRRSKRDELVEVASKLFYEQGYNNTGVQQIISAAGIAKGTFYSHFKSKEALGIAWLKARHTFWIKQLLDFVEPKKTPKDKILASFEMLERWMSECDMRGCAFLNTLCETPDADNALRTEIIAHKSELREFFQHLTEQHHRGRPQKERIQIATTIYLLFEGAIIETQLFRDNSMIDAAKAQVKNLL